MSVGRDAKWVGLEIVRGESRGAAGADGWDMATRSEMTSICTV